MHVYISPTVYVAFCHAFCLNSIKRECFVVVKKALFFENTKSHHRELKKYQIGSLNLDIVGLVTLKIFL